MTTYRPPPTSTLFPYTTLFRSHFRDDLRDVPIGGAMVDETGAQREAPLERRVGKVHPPTLKGRFALRACFVNRSEEHTSELQSHSDLVCRLLLEKKNNQNKY